MTEQPMPSEFKGQCHDCGVRLCTLKQRPVLKANPDETYWLCIPCWYKNDWPPHNRFNPGIVIKKDPNDT